ncbi:hypothetical protein AGMMS4957_16730 [Bacteroidia bacterium]|nr:hypothetical protein AGMMS4957_16730 [Bacteroidia bacterium]
MFLGEPDTRTAGFPIDTGYNPGPDNSALPFRYRTKFVNGDAIGIYVVKHYPGVPGALSSFISENFANNIKAVYDSVPGTRATWTLTDSIYHPGGDSELDFYAYYPYQPDIHYGYPTWDFYPPDPNDIPYKANMNQNTPAGFYGSDFLLGIARNIRKSVPKSLVTMQPKHAMALVEAKVFYPPGEPVDPTVNLALINVKSAASISLSDSSAKKVGNAPPPYFSSRIDSIVMYNRGIITGTSSVDTVVYWAVVPPQKIAVGTDSSTVSKKTGTLLFSRRDSVYIAADSMSTSAPATAVQLELEAGKVTTLKLKLKN